MRLVPGSLGIETMCFRHPEVLMNCLISCAHELLAVAASRRMIRSVPSSFVGHKQPGSERGKVSYAIRVWWLRLHTSGVSDLMPGELNPGIGELAQWVRVCATEPDVQSLIPGTHMAAEDNQLLYPVLCSPHVCMHRHVYTHTHTHTLNIN